MSFFTEIEVQLITAAFPTFDAPPLERLEEAVRNEAEELARDWRPVPPADTEPQNNTWMLKPTADEFLARAKKAKMQGLAGAIAAEFNTTPEEHNSRIVYEAKARLKQSDGVAVRCVKANIPYPAAWQDYDNALRAIIAAPDGVTELPDAPPLP